METTPRNLILDLLSTLRRGAFPVGALVAAGECFDVEAGSLRVALARLLEAGLVERAGRGLYRLGAGASAVQGRVHAWRGRESRTRSWNGHWIGVHLGAAGNRSVRDGNERALRFLGFRELVRGLRVRPDNLVGASDGVRATLRELGLAPDALVFSIADLGTEGDTRARALWDVPALRRRWQSAVRDLERSERRLPRLPEREAMVESFLVGGRALRELALDPLLPEPILPSQEREALVSAMRRYDRLGRAAWAPFRERHGVVSARTPADTRGSAHAAALAEAGGNA